MAKQVTRWEAEDGVMFDSEAEALAYERRQRHLVQLAEFFVRRDIIGRDDADDVARAMMTNLGWFRTVLDSAAGEG